MKATGTVPSLEPSERLEVWRSLQRAQVRITRNLETRLMRDHNIALGPYEVLSQLNAAGGRMRMNDLADRVLLSRSGLTRLIDRLQRDHLVRREACASDARGLFAVLTEEGRSQLAKAASTYEEGVHDCFLGILGDEGLRQCSALIVQLLDQPLELRA